VSLTTFEHKLHSLSVHVAYLKIFLNLSFFFSLFGFLLLILVLQILYDISEIWFVIFSRTFIATQYVHALCQSFFLSIPNFECLYLNLTLWSVNHTRNWTSTLYWVFVHGSTASVKTYIQLLTPRGGLFREKLLRSSVNSRILWNQTLYQSLHIRLSLPPRIVVSHMNPTHIVISQSLKSY